VRPEVPEVLHALRAQGIKQIVCLAEEVPGVAKQAADSLGLSRYLVDVSPAAGANMVQQLQAEGLTVAVVGDGHDNSPALAQANVGMVIADRTTLTQGPGHIVVHARDLRQLPMAITVAREGVHRVQQNRQLLVTSNTLALGLAGVGWLGPIGVLLLGHGATLVALGNALRPLLTASGHTNHPDRKD
jgi:P-type E1-E2 ATPase